TSRDRSTGPASGTSCTAAATATTEVSLVRVRVKSTRPTRYKANAPTSPTINSVDHGSGARSGELVVVAACPAATTASVVPATTPMPAASAPHLTERRS